MYWPRTISDDELQRQWRVASADVDALEAQLDVAKQRQMSFAMEDCRRRFAAQIDPIVSQLRSSPPANINDAVRESLRQTSVDPVYWDWIVDIVESICNNR